MTELMQHAGVRAETVELRRDRGADTFLSAFFSDPFNRLVKDAVEEHGQLPCHERSDIFTDLRAPHVGDDSETRRYYGAIAEAKALCVECPIVDACLERGMTTGERGALNEVGIWGGLTRYERAVLHKSRTGRSA